MAEKGSKRIKPKHVIAWASSGVVLVTTLFFYLSAIGVLTVTGHSGDTTCAGNETDPCWAFLNVTFHNTTYIYPNETWLKTYPPVTEIHMYRSWGKGLREINLTRGCSGSWCGCSWCKFGITAKYAYKFKRQDYQLSFKAYKKSPSDDVKWWAEGVEDPVWFGIPEAKTLENLTLINLYETRTFNESKRILIHNWTNEFNKTINDWNLVDYPYFIDGYVLVNHSVIIGQNVTDGKKTIFISAKEMHCTNETKNLITCDSIFDGDGDGVIESGESGIKFDVLNKNLVYESYDHYKNKYDSKLKKDNIEKLSVSVMESE